MRAVSKPPRSQTALLAALVFVLLAVVGIAAMQGSGGPALAGPDDDGAGSRAGEANVADGSFRRSDADGPAEASAATNPGGGERAAAFGDDMGSGRPLPEGARWIELLVVDKATGAPQPDALVHWYDESAHEFVNEATGDDEGWDEATEAMFQFGERVAGKAGWRMRADADGKARVTMSKYWTNVVVTHGALYGELTLRDNSVPPAGGYRVELAPDRSVRVRVLDDRGEPCADVPVGLVAVDSADADSVLTQHGTLAHTDAQGLATIPHLQTKCEFDVDGAMGWRWGRFGFGRRDDGTPPPKPAWRVRAMVLGSRDPGVAFDATTPPAEPVELRLPPTGKLRVRAEAGGKPVTSFGRAYAYRDDNQDESHELDVGKTAKADADGWARFPLVALGVRYALRSDADGGMQAECVGPTAPGQEVDVLLRSPTDAVIVSGRLLTPDRQPARNTRLSVRAVGEDLWMHETTKTDADGRFTVNLGSVEEPKVAQKLWLDTLVKDAMPQRGEVAGRALRNGREEVGDVVLGDAPLLVAGVVTAQGKPFAGEAHLVVERQMPPQYGQREGEWRWIDGQYGHKGKDGRFAVRGVLEPGNYRLHVRCEHALPVEPIAFRLGADDLKVELQPGSRLAASALLPPKTPTQQVRFTLVPSKPPAASTPGGPNERKAPLNAGIELDAQGRADVRWDTLPPDTYTLRIELWTQGRELMAIPDVVVPPPATPDPRLVDIDLRASLRVVELAVRGADGKELDECYGAAFVTNAAGGWRGETFWEDTTDLLLAPGPYELLVCVHGFRPLPVRGDGARAEARVEAWPTVAVRVAGAPKLPERATARVWLTGPKQPESKYETAWNSGDRSEYLQPNGGHVVVENGVANVPIGDGPHTLHVGLYNDEGGSEIALAQPVTVLPSQTEVAITVPEAAWQQAIAALPKMDGSPVQQISPR